MMASGLSPPPVPSTRAPPRAGAQRSGLTAPCAPPRAEAVRTVKDTQNSFSRAAAEINVLQSPPYFRADEDSFGRAPRDANWVSPRGGGSHFARRDPRGFDRERRRRAERQARRSGGSATRRSLEERLSDLVMANNERVDRAHVRANRAFEGELVFEGEWVPPTPFNGIAFLASGVVLRHLHRRTQARGAPRPSSIAHPKKTNEARPSEPRRDAPRPTRPRLTKSTRPPVPVHDYSQKTERRTRTGAAAEIRNGAPGGDGGDSETARPTTNTKTKTGTTAHGPAGPPRRTWWAMTLAAGSSPGYLIHEKKDRTTHEKA